MSINSLRPAAIPVAGRRFRAYTRHVGQASQGRVGSSLRTERGLQFALGLIWLMDGVLQLQPFMFTRSFVTQIITPNTIGQPRFVAWPITLAEHLIEPRVALFNAFAATLQILIGLGLLYRPTVKVALLSSFAWALGVWWVGEGLGGLFTGAASPLTGAPGAALLYVFAGLILWPGNTRLEARRPVRRTLVAWSVLWLGSAALWLLPANRAADATRDQIASAPSGAGWLSSIQSTLAAATEGHGLLIAIAAASLSAAIGLAVFLDRSATRSLALAVALALIYFAVGQGLGGILTGSGTDPGTGPLLVWLALAIYAIAIHGGLCVGGRACRRIGAATTFGSGGEPMATSPRTRDDGGMGTDSRLSHTHWKMVSEPRSRWEKPGRAEPARPAVRTTRGRGSDASLVQP